jgi:hypothetical protein
MKTNYEKLLDRIPADAIMKRAASISGKRGGGGARPNSGPKPTYVKCRFCGQRVTKTQAARGHGCTR